MPTVLKYTYTRSASAAGVEDAWLFGGVMRGRVPVANSVRHITLPLAASKLKTVDFCSPVMAVVNTRPFFTMGEPMPSPSFARQAILFSAEKLSGTPLPEETPLALLPRNCGQSSA